MDLDVIKLYQKTTQKQVDSFTNNINSTLSIKKDYEKIDCDTEWIDMMEDTIIYLDNILRNPNRFIVNEEDIVKVELARRVTVESIKHLSRNTNLIQDYNKKTGDVRPSKILNINKEESYDTYENRFIYSLIQNMRSFIALKKQEGIKEASLKDNKVLEYKGTSKLGKENVSISLLLDSKLSDKGNKNNNEDTLSKRIEKLELQISDLTNNEVYKMLSKQHVSLVVSPIKKTNVILKNVNFQYALKLWNYLQENVDSKSSINKDNKKYEDKDELKPEFDETFLLNYLIMKRLSNEELTEEEKKEATEKIASSMVEELLKLNQNITEDELKKIVGTSFIKVKYKQVTSDRRIIEIFDKHINKYLERVEKW